MNPFAGFLQPPTQRSPLQGVGEFVNQLSQLSLQRQGLAQDKIQQADSSARDWKRIGLQEQVQNRNFSEMDKKEVEGLLAEYQDAEDQGDPVRLNRATQLLKRYGLDVAPGSAGPAKDPRAFTGTLPGQFLPSTPRQPEAPLKSQEEFESELIAGTGKLPERMERPDTGTTPEGKAVLPQAAPDVAPLPGQNLPKVSAGTKDYPVPAGSDDLGDLDAQTETQSAAPQAASAQVPPLPGMNLPTRISKGGKTLYESTGPSGRWAPMVSQVFDPVANHADPEIAQAGKRAQAMARSLIGVDGLTPEKAIKIAKDEFDNAYRQIIDMRQTALGSKPRGGGGAGGVPSTGYATGGLRTAQGALTDDAWKAIDATMVNYGIRSLNATDNGLRGAQGGLNSSNPASQRGAIRNILKAMSGLTVNAKEEAGYERLAGLAEQARNMLAQLTGSEMSPEYLTAVKTMLQEWRAESARIRDEAGRRAADAYTGLAPQAPPDVIQGQADTIYRYFQGAGGESKYKPPAERSAPSGGGEEFGGL